MPAEPMTGERHRADKVLHLVIVKHPALHYNEYIRKSGLTARATQRKDRILQEENVKNELVIVLDFGGQYNQLVARRVRECNV